MFSKTYTFRFHWLWLLNMSALWICAVLILHIWEGRALIGFNYYCLWSSLKRSKKGSVANADPHGFLHSVSSFSCTCMHTDTDTHTHTHTHVCNPPHPSHRSTPSHTHITPPTVRLQIANQGDSIDLQTTARERHVERERERGTLKQAEKSMFFNVPTVSTFRFFSLFTIGV